MDTASCEVNGITTALQKLLCVKLLYVSLTSINWIQKKEQIYGSLLRTKVATETLPPVAHEGH
jgi:hypothetical protein